MRPVLFFFCLMFFLLPSARSGEDAGTDDEIVIGATFPLTGRFDMYGQSAYYGADTCVKIINAAGGVNGKKLVLVWRDNRSDSEQAVRDVREFAEKFHVPAVLGPLLSDAAMAARRVSERLGVVVMSPMATMDAVTADQDRTWTFRACFNNSAQAAALIRFQMEKFGAVSAGVLFDSMSLSSAEAARVFRQQFREAGGRITGSYSFTGQNGEKDYEAPLKRLAEGKPDFIFAPCYALEATELMRAARDSGVDIRICGSDMWDNELVFNASGRRLAGTAFTSSLFERHLSYRPFQTFFTAMEQAGMDDPDAQAALAYDAVLLLAAALKKGESPEAVRSGLLAVRRMPLATGRTSISPDGNAVKPVLLRLVEISQGRLTPVYAERYDP